jgi:hypothetical protein
MPKTYNGHPSYNAWNVSLWLNNDEGLYTLMRAAIAGTPNSQEAAKYVLDVLADAAVTKTPDGAPYTLTNIRRAMVGV